MRTTALLTLLISFPLAGTGHSDLVITFDQSDLSYNPSAVPQTIDVDVLVSSTDGSVLSGFTFDYSVSSPLSLPTMNFESTSDFTWNLAPPTQSVSAPEAFAASGSTNHSITTTPSRLGTLRFIMDAGFSGSVPIELTYSDARRDFFTQIPDSDFSFPTGTAATLTAVPEPSGFLFLTIIGVAVGGKKWWNRKRTGKQFPN